MIATARAAWPLLLGIFLLLIGNSLQGSLIGVRGKLEGFDPLTMGLIMSGYFAGFLGGSIFTPILLRKVGHVRVFAALGSLASAAFILYASVVHPVAWALLRLVVGLCFSGLYVVAESWLNDISTNENRGQALSLYIIIQMAGVISGQALLNVADPAGYDLFVLISVVVSLAFAPILLSVTPAPLYQTATPMTFRELYRVSPLGCVGMLIMGSMFAAMFGMTPVYLGEIGYGVGHISVLMSTIYIGGLVAQYPIGWLSDRMDRRILITGAFLTAAAGALIGLMFAPNSFALILSMFLMGAAANPLYALLLAYTNDFVSNDKMAAVCGGLVFMNGFGAMVGPLVIGESMRQFGPSAYFIFLFIAPLGAFAYALYRMTQRAAPSADETAPYVALPARPTVVTAGIAAETAIEAMEEQAKETDDAQQ